MANKLNVKLIASTPDAEKVVSAAAKLCYSKTGIDGINEKLTKESTDKFLKMLMSLGHQSPIEHVSFTFAIEGISRVLTHQLVRHRIASYSQQSQRYVKLDQFEYVVPPAIEKNEIAKKIFLDTMKKDQEAYDDIVLALLKGYCDEKVEGNCENSIIYIKEKSKKMYNSLEKKAIEDARYVFPNACETKIIVTMNARSLINFFEHRACNRAQWEIRQLSIEMLRIVRKEAPTLFENIGPKCLKSECPEGKMTCGKIKEVREVFKTY